MIHLYALAASPLELPLAGVAGEPVTTVACGPLHAVVSEHTRRAPLDQTEVLAHASVVAAAAEEAPAVPVRFGSTYADVAVLRAAVAEKEEPLLATLERIGDTVEFVVRHAHPLPAPERVTVPPQRAEGHGRAYLEARSSAERTAREARTAAAAELSAVTDPLRATALETVAREGHAGPERCFLVRRADAEPFAASARARLADRDDLLLGGPWPPYTFAEVEVGR